MSLAQSNGWACQSTLFAMVLSWQPTATSCSQNMFPRCRYDGSYCEDFTLSGSDKRLPIWLKSQQASALYRCCRLQQ